MRYEIGFSRCLRRRTHPRHAPSREAAEFISPGRKPRVADKKRHRVPEGRHCRQTKLPTSAPPERGILTPLIHRRAALFAGSGLLSILERPTR